MMKVIYKTYAGDKLFFACTGLLISWHAHTHTRKGKCTRARQVILTSASLFRTRDDEDEIDKKLRVSLCMILIISMLGLLGYICLMVNL
jgi:hypothetical protein